MDAPVADQKVNLAHLEEKLNQVQRAYSRMASERSRWMVDGSRTDQVFLRHPEGEERAWPGNLLNQAELAALLVERTQASNALQETFGKLRSVGIEF